MKNIDIAFRHIRMFSIIILSGMLLLCGFVVFKSYAMLTQVQQKVYVLVNGKALEAYASDLNDNIPAEAKDHIKTFHQLFFTLSPDEKAIKENLGKSFYLADQSARRAYENLTESNYYSNIITGNVSQTIKIDSIVLDLNQTPYYFQCKGTQTITRSTSIVTRSLVTEGYLSRISRSDNNSHGFLIERWKTLENKDTRIERR